MSIVGVKQTTGRGAGSWACAVCIAGEKSRKERTTTAVEIAEKRNGWFITIPPSNQRLGKLYGYVRVGQFRYARREGSGAQTHVKDPEWFEYYCGLTRTGAHRKMSPLLRLRQDNFANHCVPRRDARLYHDHPQKGLHCVGADVHAIRNRLAG